jgi:hypothetical protein
MTVAGVPWLLPGAAALENGPFVDYYEFLMISPQADRAMVEWAVRLMLARYGKKNDQQGDEEKYNLVKEAYRVLADPKRRAAYDKDRQAMLPSTEAVTSGGVSTMPERVEGAPLDPDSIHVSLVANIDDVRLQKRIRQGLMSSLYDVMITRPRNPELGRADIARAIGVSIDQMEFAIWYLRERELLRTTPQGLYAVTTKGVDWVENGGVEHLTEKPAAPTLSADQPTLRLGQAAVGPRRVV